jgi:putative SOS response-associated peptidase YedK
VCGRFTLFESDRILAREFGVPPSVELLPRYNIAPTQTVAAVRISPASGTRELVLLRWGFIPSWAKDPAVGNRLINARSETAHLLPAFRDAFRARRCLIPASGFYEWRKQGPRKQPFYVRMRDGRPLAFAGLWERWEDPGGTAMETCTILTTDANPILSPIHDRMPAIVAPRDHGLWLDPSIRDPKALKPVLSPCDADAMEVYPVTTLVNDPSHEGAECIREGS